MNQEVHILYHGGCADGFGAAWAAHRYFRKFPSVTTHYLPQTHGGGGPDVPEDGTVYILDFSYPLETMLELTARCREVILLDHHETGREELEGKVPGCLFDMGHSGAQMAWTHFHPDEPTPGLILYIEDRDLWRWELPDSREVSAALDSHPQEFQVWDGLYPGELADDGKAILRRQQALVERIAGSAKTWNISGNRIPAVSSPILASEICEELLRRFPKAPFCAVYREEDMDGQPEQDGQPGRTVRKWSLRSREGGKNVARVASLSGGGGHPTAAGFQEEIPRRARRAGLT